jgi:hypothetical protein
MADDGLTYMSIEDFVRTWDRVYVNNLYENWVTSSVSVTNDRGSTRASFDNPVKQEVFISVDFWPHRMFPYGCKNSPTYGYLSVIDSKGRYLANTIHRVSDRRGYGWIRYEDLEPGKYTIKIEMSWKSIDLKELSLSTYASRKAPVKYP